MSSPGGPPRVEGPNGPYGGYGGALQDYGTAPYVSPAPVAPPPSGPPPTPVPQPYGPQLSGPTPLPAYPVPVGSPPRPAGIATASTLAVTASLLFGCALGLLWIVAYSITASFDPSANDQTVIFHLAERFQLRLTQGLAVPLFGFPLAGAVAGFLVIVQRPWTRWLFTAVGVLALGWTGWWLRHSLIWWLPVALYIGTACGVVWTRAAGRWYAAGALNRPGAPAGAGRG